MDKILKPVPWIPHLALEFLETILRPDMTVFEYGSGGSTLYFSDHAKGVVSVEHDPKWYTKMKGLIADSPNVFYRLIEPELDAIGDDKSNPDHYTSNPLMANFRKYVCAIDDYDNFDLIFIDGRSRASCVARAARKARRGDWIILDNAERDYYLRNTSHLFEHWESVWVFGHGPYIDWPWETLFMRCS